MLGRRNISLQQPSTEIPLGYRTTITLLDRNILYLKGEPMLMLVAVLLAAVENRWCAPPGKRERDFVTTGDDVLFPFSFLFLFKWHFRRANWLTGRRRRKKGWSFGRNGGRATMCSYNPLTHPPCNLQPCLYLPFQGCACIWILQM